MFWAFYFKCVGPFILSVLGCSLKCVRPFLRKNQEKTLKMNGKRKTGESNSSNLSLPLGVWRRRPSRRLVGAVLKELLPVPTGYNPQSLTSLSLSKFQNLEIFLSKVQTLTSLHSRLWLWQGSTPPAAAGCHYLFPLP